MNIFVGNLSFSVTENNVRSLFETFGVVSSVSIKNKSGKNARGFGFLVMPDDVQAQAAIAALEGKDFMGKPLSISVQRPKAVKPKKDWKEIKRLRLEAKNKISVDDAPTIPEKELTPKVSKEFGEDKKPRKKVREQIKKASQPPGSQAWSRRKGRGTAKPWKKKPGGVNKKFKYAAP